MSLVIEMDAVTDPRDFTIQEAVKYVLVRQYWMTCNSVEERLQHTLTPRNHSGILLCLCLLDSIIANSLFRGYRWYYERGIQFDKVSTQRLELGVSVSSLCILMKVVVSTCHDLDGCTYSPPTVSHR